MSPDEEVRLAAFEWLKQQTAIHGEVLPWSLLIQGFQHRGRRIPQVSQQGIFRPAGLDYPLSIRSSPSGPYTDSFGPSVLLYKYRGVDINHSDNVGLRRAMKDKVPLVYFFGVAEGRYLAIWPVFVVGDEPERLTFMVEVDESDAALRLSDAAAGFIAEDTPYRRRYVTALVRRRLHQRAFRELVLRAYKMQCALCRLRHEQLLDAAHILSDSDEGEPRVRNGLALCKLHHAAFDAFFLTVRPDYIVEVRRDILEESDGPMLIHGLQELHGRPVELPRRAHDRPDPELLGLRYQRFCVPGTER